MKYLKSKYSQIKSSFVNFVISRFAPDYKEIKAENEKLKQDIYHLIKKRHEIEGMTAEVRWKIVFDAEEMIMYGAAIERKDGNFLGFLSQKSED